MRNWNKGERFKTGVVADVDCTSGGKSLCQRFEVNKFPSIKWGDPSTMEKYTGERDYDSLKKFAFESLKPKCSPVHQDRCGQKEKSLLAEFMALSEDELSERIEEGNQKIKEAEDTFDGETNMLHVEYDQLQERVKALQAKHEQLQKDKDDAIADVRNSGLDLMNAVRADRAKNAKAEL